jgi:RNA polymerase subunit RPABC4/transcription elongation factor Spt4
MPKELQGVTDAIGGVFDSPAVQLGLRAIAVYWIIFWLAASYWAFRDLQLRTDNPVLPYLAAAFIILFTPILFPAAIVIYRIVRPHEKIDEVYERTLAQEAMLAEIETVRSCPTCRRRVHEDWIICPTCRTRLARVCPNCSRLVGLDWSICAWCGRDFERRDVVAAVSAAPTPTLPAGAPHAPATPMATPLAATTGMAAAAVDGTASGGTSVRPPSRAGSRTTGTRSPGSGRPTGRTAPGSVPES